jgi:Recombination endonuclease VII
MKQCSKCGKEKDESEFSPSRDNRGKVRPHSWCKACANEENKRRWHLADDNFKIQRSKQTRARGLKRKYGITLEQYNEMSLQQNGVCAICHRPQNAGYGRWGGKLPLAVDHNHTTGGVRGLLCNRCNALLGAFENKELVFSILAYLERHK